MIWAVSLSTEDLCTQGLTSARRIRRFSGRGGTLTSLAQPKSDSTPALIWWVTGKTGSLSPVRCSTDIDFVENQLSPGSFSFSLLATAHPRFLQQSPVRPVHSRPLGGGSPAPSRPLPRTGQWFSRRSAARGRSSRQSGAAVFLGPSAGGASRKIFSG